MKIRRSSVCLICACQNFPENPNDLHVRLNGKLNYHGRKGTSMSERNPNCEHGRTKLLKHTRIKAEAESNHLLIFADQAWA